MKLFRVLNICFNFCNATVIALNGFSMPFYADFIMSIKDLTEEECIDECISRFECKSLAVRPGNICILYPFRNSSQTYLGYAPYFTYLERTEIAPIYESGCKHLVCGSGQKCVEDSGCGCAYCQNGAAGNHMSEYLLRESGCWMVLPILMLYMNRRSRDETILGSLLWSRALGNVPVLIMLVYSLMTLEKKLKNMTMWSAIFFYSCQWVFSVYQLAKTRPSLGRREVKGVVGVICRLNFLVLFLIGLMSMAFPKMLFENQSLTPKTIDLHLSRFLGALIFAMIIPAWYSASFRHNEDRKNFFSCQLLVMALLTGAQMHNFFWEKSFPTKDLVPWLIGDVIMLACPLVGLVIITKEEKDAEDNRTHYYFRTRKIE